MRNGQQRLVVCRLLYVELNSVEWEIGWKNDMTENRHVCGLYRLTSQTPVTTTARVQLLAPRNHPRGFLRLIDALKLFHDHIANVA